MNLTYDFTGQVALVTVASSGMRLATARAFAQAGAAVVLSDINEDTLRTAIDDLTPAATPHADHSNPPHPFSAHCRALLGGAPLRTKGEYPKIRSGRKTV